MPQVLKPILSTVDHPTHYMDIESFNLLWEQMNFHKLNEAFAPLTISLETNVIARASSVKKMLLTSENQYFVSDLKIWFSLEESL
jgi:DNA-binding LacI/PurR family transcriptional regulator